MNYRNLLFMLLILITAAIATSQPNPPREMMKDLNLTDAQKEQFEKITYEMKKKEIELKAKAESVKLDIHRMLMSETIDKAAIEKKMNEMASHQVALHMNKLNAWTEKNKVLNADQQKVWKKGMALHLRAKFGQNNGRMMRMHQMDNDMPMHMDDTMTPRMERRIEKKIIKE